MASPDTFKEVLEKRMQAKASGDKQTSNTLKLVINTTYGASLNTYNDLYDPLMARSVCISGQLYLIELAEHLYKDVPDLEIVSMNTDAVQIMFDDKYYDQVQEILNEWQSRTGFSLEEDKVKKIAIKDVNNYVELLYDGTVNIKGGYLVRGVSHAGAFKVNNNATIVAKALIDYFTKGIAIEQTIKECDDILAYQFIAKAGSKYDRAYQLVGDKEIPIQKVNRVYASKNRKYGKLYKVKAANGQIAKIEGLPEYCIIDNDNHLTIDDIDKQYYIDFAKKRLNDFLGIERKKKVATSTTKTKLTKWQKLNKARSMFLDEGVKKEGFNEVGSSGYFYFELKDIVPVATKIFEEVGLTHIEYLTDTKACADVYDSEVEGEPIHFEAPLERAEQIVSNAGKVVTTKIQTMGSTITYYRRYLYQLILDIVEKDEVDSTETTLLNNHVVEKPVYTTPEEREAIKKDLTNPNGLADELQVEGLKNLLKELVAKQPDKQAMADRLSLSTNDFTNLKKADCENIMAKINEMMGEGNE